MSEIPKVVEPKLMETNYWKEIFSTEWTPISESPKWKEIIKNTQKNTKEVKKESNTSFDSISENTEYNKILQELINGTSFYIDSELWNDFSKIEKDNIKLVLLSYLTNKVNNIDLWIIDWITEQLKWFLDFFKNEKDNNKKKEKFKNFFTNLWINWIQEDLDIKINEIKRDKKNKDFSNLNKAFNSIKSIKKPEWDILKTIKNNLSNTSKKFDKIQVWVNNVKNTFEKMWMWDILWDLINWLKTEFPFLWKLFEMFMWWWETTSNNSEKTKKSVKNLETFIEKDKEKSPLDKIEKNWNFRNKEKLNPKKLETFYKYLDSKSIDYTKENFWEEFLNWTSKDSKIIELHNLLNSIQDKKLKWTQLKYISLEKFIEILNNLEKTEEANKKIKFEKEKKEKITKLKEEENSPSISKEKKEELKKERQKLEVKKYQSFEDLLKEWLIIIDWKKEKIKTSQNWKNIEIWKDKYSISIIANIFLTEKEVFESINLNNWELTVKANWETVTYWIEKAKPILQTLIKNWNYSKQIEWKPATLIIKKA